MVWQAAAVETCTSEMSDVYAPNDAYRLFRLVLEAPSAKTNAAVHVACADPRASLLVRAVEQTGDPLTGAATERELCTVAGLGCATLLALPVEPPPPPPAKGAEPAAPVTLILEGTVDRISAIALGLPTRPPLHPIPPAAGGGEGGGEDGGEDGGGGGGSGALSWSVTAVGWSAVNVVADGAPEALLRQLESSWESAQPGRAAKAREARQTFLDERAAAEEAASAAAAAEAAEAAEAAAAAEDAEAAAAVAEAAEAEAASVPTGTGAEAAKAHATHKLPAAGEAGRLLGGDELEQWKAERQAALDSVAATRESAEGARGGLRDAMGADAASVLEVMRAERAKAAEAYQVLVEQRQGLLEKHLPPPPEPPEPIDPKGKGKKK